LRKCVEIEQVRVKLLQTPEHALWA
jgi:hypothetical protein